MAPGPADTAYAALPDYSISTDLDDGSLFAIDIHGHGYDHATIETFVAMIVASENAGAGVTGWDVSQVWRRTVPLRGEHEGTGKHHYQHAAGPGAKAVTHLLRVREPGFWCHNHPDRPWSMGFPVTSLVDGEALASAAIARADAEVDPRRVVQVSTWEHVSDAIMFCRPCACAIRDRLIEARHFPVDITAPTEQESARA
jgi:hypothetical protein